MSPYQIGILLHYYCRAEDHEDLVRNPPVWGQTIEGFLAAGLLERNTGDMAYKITERGKTYVDALQRVPLPVQMWVIPGGKA